MATSAHWLTAAAAVSRPLGTPADVTGFKPGLADSIGGWMHKAVKKIASPQTAQQTVLARSCNLEMARVPQIGRAHV